jgi:hypothetical protein
MTGFSRGAALIEAALTVGIVLTLLLGAVQIGVLGFTQSAQDGAVFVAAHTYAQRPASGTSRATTAANSVFDAVPSSGIAMAPSGSLVTATAAATGSAPSIPGAPVSISLLSGATERFVGAGTAGGFAAVSTLTNYRDASGTPQTTHPLVPAQPGLASGGGCDQTGGNQGCDGNHQHVDYTGPSAEFDCRLAAYNALVFPSQRPTGNGTGPGSVWDPASSSSPLNPIYGWDSSTSCH